jgi:hypothetical protein
MFWLLPRAPPALSLFWTQMNRFMIPSFHARVKIVFGSFAEEFGFRMVPIDLEQVVLSRGEVLFLFSESLEGARLDLLRQKDRTYLSYSVGYYIATIRRKQLDQVPVPKMPVDRTMADLRWFHHLLTIGAPDIVRGELEWLKDYPEKPVTMQPVACKGIQEVLGMVAKADLGVLEKLCNAILAANPGKAQEFKAGNDEALNWIIGQIMKTHGHEWDLKVLGVLLREKMG